MANNKSVEEYVEWFKKKDRLGSQFNIKIVSLDGDECVAEYQALEEHYNPNDILHGGALYTVMDSCQGAFLHFAQVPEEYKAAATGTATIKYVKPVFAQELISVRTWLDRQEGRMRWAIGDE